MTHEEARAIVRAGRIRQIISAVSIVAAFFAAGPALDFFGL